MPFAITLRLDPGSTSLIEAMWEALAAQGIDDDCRRLGYAPHLTLAVYPDEIGAASLRAALEAVAPSWDVLPVTLSGLGMFPGPPALLWAAPVATSELLARHAALLSALPGSEPDPHYRIGAWMPHVTLSGGLSDPGRALEALLPLWRPCSGTLDHVDLVHFRPVEVLHSRTLAPARSV